MSILRVAVASPLRRTFDYLLPPGVTGAGIEPGQRVRVPFGSRTLIGVVVAVGAESDVAPERLRRALEIVDVHALLTPGVLRVLHWALRYYHHAPGDVILGAFPAALRKTVMPRRARRPVAPPQPASATPHSTNAAQRAAIEQVTGAFGHFRPFVLAGVTGSGKTEVYLALIEATLRRGEQALVLVPEIGLTPQLVGRIRARIDAPLAVLHSGLADGERAHEWLFAQRGEARVVVGTRSAVFTPLPNPGLIIVDEEHDTSFKQHEGFRYSARDIAVMRAKEEGVPVVLGSATPSLETLANVDAGRYTLLALPERAGAATAPKIQVIDVRTQPMRGPISLALREAMTRELAAGRQVLLFLNRRGYAPTLYCAACGWIATCTRCDAHLVVHRRDGILRCHHCGTERAVGTVCGACGSGELRTLGAGTERAEQVLADLFPGASVLRLDRDTTRRKNALADALAEVRSGKYQILIGTQMLAKGHDFPDVTLVGVLNTDQGLFSADFRASERMAQLLVQVAGRAGRGTHAGQVLIQTACPDHPLLRVLLTKDYSAFARAALRERREAGLPPYAHLALVRAEATRAGAPAAFLERIAALRAPPRGVQLLGPAPAPMEKRAGRFRAQLLVSATQRTALHRFLDDWIPAIEALPEARRVRWSLDVDPVEIF